MNATATPPSSPHKPPDEPDPYGFEPTIWTDVEAVRTTDPEVRRAALDRLLRKYRAPLLAFLRAAFGRWRRVTPEWLEDCLHLFINQKVMHKGLMEAADRKRGRFRSWLKTALWRFVVQQHRALVRRGRHEEPMAEGVEELPGRTSTHCLEFEREWARCLLNEALLHLEEGCKEGDQAMIWLIFLRRRLLPLAGDASVESLEQTAAYIRDTCGETLTSQKISNCQKTAERKLHRYIRDVLAEYCPNAEDIEEELLAFIEILRGGIALPTRFRPQPHTH